jgi:phage FluMu protein Com
MALPKLNDNPSYRVTVPSTGQETSFRPFLVKEQKALLIAYETQDKKDMIRAVLRTIEACVEEPLKGNLTTFDVDYLFTKIRAKSVGETADIQVKCSKCEAVNEVSVELDEVVMSGEVSENVIALNDDVSIEMRYPTYEQFMDSQTLLEDGSPTETLMDLLVVCMDSVLTEEERIDMSGETRESINEFLESMTADQFERVTTFVSNMPTVSQDIVFKCTSCKTKNTRTLKGMDDFF